MRARKRPYLPIVDRSLELFARLRPPSWIFKMSRLASRLLYRSRRSIPPISMGIILVRIIGITIYMQRTSSNYSRMFLLLHGSPSAAALTRTSIINLGVNCQKTCTTFLNILQIKKKFKQISTPFTLPNFPCKLGNFDNFVEIVNLNSKKTFDVIKKLIIYILYKPSFF